MSVSLLYVCIKKNHTIINVSPIMAYYPFGYDGICVCEGENQFCYMTFSFCILYALGEELCGHILKGCRNGHSEKHDGCGRLQVLGDVDKTEWGRIKA